jgi:hypothetical protein
VLIHPRPELLRSGVWAVVAAGIPLFAVLYWLSVSQGGWRRVLLVNIVFAALVLLLIWRTRTAYVRVDDEAVTKSSFVRRTVLSTAQIATVVVAETYRGGSSDTIPQLVALSTTGARLLRLRGTFWARADILTVADALGARVTVLREPLSPNEYYRLYPGVAYWYEGKRWSAIAGLLLAFAAAASTVTWIMAALGSSGE